MGDWDLDVEILCAEGRCQLRVSKQGQVSIAGEPRADLYAYSVQLVLPNDADGRTRLVTKTIVHYEPHGWRRLLLKAVEAVV